MKLRKLITLSIALFALTNCKKETKNEQPVAESPGNRIFTNVSDPRLAEVVTSDQRSITFYGGKNSDGKPTSLYAYKIKSLTDTTKTDLFTFDNAGRYSDVIFNNGSKVHFDYNKTNDSVFIAVSSSTKVIPSLPLNMFVSPKGNE